MQAELKESNSLVALNRAGVEKRKREAKEAEEKLAMFEFYKTEYLRLKMQIDNKTELWKLFKFYSGDFFSEYFLSGPRGQRQDAPRGDRDGRGCAARDRAC